MRTPYFCIDEQKLRQNGEILRAVAKEAGCKILLAQKAYSVYQTYPLLEEYLSGTAASGVYEAKLGREHFRGEVHAFSPAFREEDVARAKREQIARIDYDIEHLVDYTIKWYDSLREKYGSRYPRLTQVRSFDTIDATKVAEANEQLYINREEGFIGTSLKKD